MIPRKFKLLVLLLPLLIARACYRSASCCPLTGGLRRLSFAPGRLGFPARLLEPKGNTMRIWPIRVTSIIMAAASQTRTASRAIIRPCPFAFAAAAPLTVTYSFASEPPSSEAIADTPDSAILVVAFRAHPIRGPPALS